MALLRYDAGLRARIRRTLATLEPDLMASVAAADPTNSKKITVRRKRLNALLKRVQEQAEAIYASVDAFLGGEFRQVAFLEADWTKAALDTVLAEAGTALSAARLGKGRVEEEIAKANVFGAPAEEWWRRQAFDARNAAADAIRAGFLEGEDAATLAKRIKLSRAEGGAGLDIAYRHAETLASTALSELTNRVRVAAILANPDIARGFVHLSRLDSRTSAICVARSGLRWTLNRRAIGHRKKFMIPALHFRCRSVLSLWWRPASQMKIAKGGIRADAEVILDGEPPRDLDIDAWLRRQGEGKVNDMLGKGRADLWRSGSISARQLVTADNRPLSLEELRRLH